MVAHTLDTSNRCSSGFSWLSILQIPFQGTLLVSAKIFLSLTVLCLQIPTNLFVFVVFHTVLHGFRDYDDNVTVYAT